MEYDGSINKDISVSVSSSRSGQFNELSNKIDLLLMSLSHFTNLLEKNLEENRYAAIRERERRW